MPRPASKKTEEVEAPVVSKPRAKAVSKSVSDEEVAPTRTRRTRTAKDSDPNAPKRPHNAFIIFTIDYRKNHAKELAKFEKTTDQGRHMGEVYRGLNEKEKKRFQDQADKLKAAYAKDLAAYQASK